MSNPKAFDLLRAVRDLKLPPPPPKLTATDKLILALLAMRADASGFCWSSYTTLAANGWMSRRAAKKAIAHLVAAGLVEIRVRRVSDGDGRLARAANGYVVLVRVVSAGSDDSAEDAPEVGNSVHQVVNIIHQGGELSSPVVVNPVHGGGEQSAHRSATTSTPSRATEKIFALTGEKPAQNVVSIRSKKPPKHSPNEIAAKTKIVDAFIATVEGKKGIKPDVSQPADNAAAFQLAKKYGADEASTIITRALEDPFVLGSNCTLRYIASKADSWRGTAPAAKGTKPTPQPNDPANRWSTKIQGATS